MSPYAMAMSQGGGNAFANQLLAQQHGVGNQQRGGAGKGPPDQNAPVDPGAVGWFSVGPNSEESIVEGTNIRRIPLKGLSSVIQMGRKGGRALALVPSDLDLNRPVEVLLHLHGRGSGHQNAQDVKVDQIEQQLYASGRNMIGMLPQGAGTPTFNPNWNQRDESGERDRSHAMDADAFIDEVLATVFPKHPVERGGTMLTAHSGGGDAASDMLGSEKGPSDLMGVAMFEAINKSPSAKTSVEMERHQQFLAAKLKEECDRLKSMHTAQHKLDWLSAHGFRYRSYYIEGKHGGYVMQHTDADRKFKGAGEAMVPSMKIFLDDWFKANADSLGGEGSVVYDRMRENYQLIAVQGRDTEDPSNSASHTNLIGKRALVLDALEGLPPTEKHKRAPMSKDGGDLAPDVTLLQTDNEETFLATRARLLAGALRNEGEYSHENGFVNDELNHALAVYAQNWLAGPPNWAPLADADARRAEVGHKRFKLRYVTGWPVWFSELQMALTNQPRWTSDEQGANAVLEAFLLYRTTQDSMEAGEGDDPYDGESHGGLEEWYAHVGKSEVNGASDSVVGNTSVATRQKHRNSPLLPQLIQNGRTWCAPGHTSITLKALAAHGYQFKRPAYSRSKDKPADQRGGDLQRWQRGQTLPPSPSLWNTPLEPGDRAEIVRNGGPASGHVVSVIRDFGPGDGSRVQIVSANTMGGQGSVSVEEFVRRQPPAGYDHQMVSKHYNPYRTAQSEKEALERQLEGQTLTPAEEKLVEEGLRYGPPSLEAQAAMDKKEKLDKLANANKRMKPWETYLEEERKKHGKEPELFPRKYEDAWVVSIVRMNELDPNAIDAQLKELQTQFGDDMARLTAAEEAVLKKYGLERIPGWKPPGAAAQSGAPAPG
ncbi:MAG: hypothetical protein AAFV53_33855 [Myxococcota bacterium]